MTHKIEAVCRDIYWDYWMFSPKESAAGFLFQVLYRTTYDVVALVLLIASTCDSIPYLNRDLTSGATSRLIGLVSTT